jgi:hypothetical protein
MGTDSTSPITSKRGTKGVWMTTGGRYAARIKVAGKITYVGSFDTIKKASEAYAKVAKKSFGNLRYERG